jgi:hypothetical protein
MSVVSMRDDLERFARVPVDRFAVEFKEVAAVASDPEISDFAKSSKLRKSRNGESSRERGLAFRFPTRPSMSPCSFRFREVQLRPKRPCPRLHSRFELERPMLERSNPLKPP